MLRSVLVAGSALILWACGAPAAQSESAPSSASAGGEQALPAEPAPEPAPEPGPQAAPSGPATLTVVVSVKGEEVPASVRLIDGAGAEAASGHAGDTLGVESGDYTLEVEVDDAAVLADKPKQRSPITLAPGASVRHPIELPWASIQLRVRVNGKVDGGAEVDIMRHGEVVTTMRSDGEHVMVSPGRYDARVRTRRAEIEVPQLMFPQGATRTLPVDVQM